MSEQTTLGETVDTTRVTQGNARGITREEYTRGLNTLGKARAREQTREEPTANTWLI